MTPLITLSIACASFIAGFALGLMGIALLASLQRESYDHDAGAAEGDQTSFTQRGSSSPG